jgi:ribosomal protein S21
MSANAKGRPIIVSVETRGDEPPENLLKRFLKKCKKDKISEYLVEKSAYSRRYEKPSDLNRAKRGRAKFKQKKQTEELLKVQN